MVQESGALIAGPTFIGAGQGKYCFLLDFFEGIIFASLKAAVVIWGYFSGGLGFGEFGAIFFGGVWWGRWFAGVQIPKGRMCIFVSVKARMPTGVFLKKSSQNFCFWKLDFKKPYVFLGRPIDCSCFGLLCFVSYKLVQILGVSQLKWKWKSRWWFQIFFISTPTWGNDPIWLIFFRWVEITN